MGKPNRGRPEQGRSHPDRRKPTDNKGLTLYFAAWMLGAWGSLSAWIWMPGTAIVQPLAAIVGLALALSALGVAGVVLLVRGRGEPTRILVGAPVLVILCAVGIGVSLPHLANRLLDSQPSMIQEAAFSSRSTYKGRTGSTLRLVGGPFDGAVFHLSGDWSYGHVHQVGLHPGRLGWAWVDEGRGLSAR